MQTIKITIRPVSAFASNLTGDMLFGQLCCHIALKQGQNALSALLANYKTRPFAVISDAFLSGHLPKPTLPAHMLISQHESTVDVKQFKSTNLISLDCLTKPLSSWGALAVKDQNSASEDQTHNSINRLVNATDSDGFAPFTQSQTVFVDGAQATELDFYMVNDESVYSSEQLLEDISDIGQYGFGKNASTGKGRFTVKSSQLCSDLSQANSNAYLTLAAVAPQGLPLVASMCFYKTWVKFGRHGPLANLKSPYKAPIVLAAAGAVLTPQDYKNTHYIGQAIGGSGELSLQSPETVHQGYAPTIGIHLSLSEAL